MHKSAQDIIDELLVSIRAGKQKFNVDSRKIEPGDVFLLMPRSRGNSGEFIIDALNRGAQCVIGTADAKIPDELENGSYIAVEDPVRILADFAQAMHGTEDLPIRIIGITGTNGKTTCAWLMEYLLSCNGFTTGLLGTIEYHWPGCACPAPLTTPGAMDLHAMLGKMKNAHVDAAVMEVSSHALDQRRIEGINFSGGIFTNLTQDHLDYHHNLEDYFQAKARFFLDVPYQDKALAINYDDPYGRRLLALLPQALSFGLTQSHLANPHLFGQIISQSPEGMILQMEFNKRRWTLQTPLVGAFNASNLLAVQGLALALGMHPEQFTCLQQFHGVPGRMERIGNSKGLNVFVDYAHTPDALTNALRALRGAGFTRIITVFGCGGNRDRNKRPLMGKAVAELTDIAILTSDNPRLEEPEAIMRDVEPGLAGARKVYYEPDRHKATQIALELASPADAVLVAGKGHEDYQILGEQRIHYSDRETIVELLG